MTLLDAGAPPPGTRRHTLLVAEDDRARRPAAAAWVQGALAGREKVFYKGWYDPAAPVEEHWLAGPDGPREGAAALRSGQLELADYGSVLDATGWTNDGARRYHTAEIERALDEGWSSVAMAHETVRREMADGAEAADVAEHEAGYDVLMRRWPLRVLCQLTLSEENPDAIRETVTMHHPDVVDRFWSAATVDGIWRPRGEIDATVTRRFGAAATGALRASATAPHDPDLHVDLSAVDFIDAAGVQRLMEVALSAPAGQRIVLHHAARTVQRLVEAVGRPRNVVLDGGR